MNDKDYDRLFERLRARAATVGLGKNFGYYTDASAKTDIEAADALVAMQARIAVLEEALRFYAEPDCHGEGVKIPDFYSELDFGEIARAALAKGETK